MKKLLVIIFSILIIIILFFCIYFSNNRRSTKLIENNKSLNNEKMAANNANIKLGAYYWSGFTYLDDHYTKRLFSEFSGREPIWGWVEDSVENMEKEINIASENGISFFAFDWYYKHDLFNTGLNNYLKASNNNKLEFLLTVILSGEAAVSESTWKDASQYYIDAMSNSQYLKVDDKPVIIFFRTEDLINQLGGVSKTKSSLDYLRNEMKNRGYDDIIVLGCECAYGYNGELDYNPKNTNITDLKARLKSAKDAGFNGFTSYNCRQYRDYDNNINNKSISYEVMADQHIQNSEALYNYGEISVVPNILSGWDSRPWETDWSQNTTGWWSLYASNRTPQKLYQHILNTESWMINHKDKTIGNLAIIYAWNEVCEGGYLVPTKEDGYSYLYAVKNAVNKINN